MISSNNEHTYIIAEAGVNHNGSLELALKLIFEAKKSGANAVKFQTFNAKKLVTQTAQQASYQIANMANKQKNNSQYAMLKKLELSNENFFELKKYADEIGIDFLSTPFDEESLLFLINDLKLKTIKFSSGDLLTAPLLVEAAKHNVEIILSTGMATLQDIECALGFIMFTRNQKTLKSNIAPKYNDAIASWENEKANKKLLNGVSVLHCTTEYPAPIESVNLKAIHALKNSFGLVTGYTDHTKGIHVSIAAVAAGAEIIEKHFTLDKNFEGPDHKASIDPAELKEMITTIREINRSMGNGFKNPFPEELKNKLLVTKSLVANMNIKTGEVFTDKNVLCKRPGSGIPAMMYWDLLGKKAKKNYNVDDLIDNNEI
jgi:N-acetylneuraminate synthase